MAIPYFQKGGAVGRLLKTDEDVSEPVSGKQLAILRWSGFLDRDLRYFLQVMETNIARVDLPPPLNLSVTNGFGKAIVDAKQRYYILSGLFLPSLSKAVRLFF